MSWQGKREAVHKLKSNWRSPARRGNEGDQCVGWKDGAGVASVVKWF
jgi:hypothetical protein